MQAHKTTGSLTDKKVRLKPYQEKGVRLIHKYVHREGGCLLGDEQGLGKTPQALVWLRKEPDAFPALVVCPSAATHVWERECRKWCTDSVTIADRPGCPLVSKVIIISYDSLSREIERLMAVPFRSLVIDEIHFIANRTSLRFRMLQKLAVSIFYLKKGKRREQAMRPRIKYRLGISGTPIPNKSVDLWSTLSILWPRHFSSFWDFAWEFSHPFKPPGRGYWIFSGARNPDRLRHLLGKFGLIRRYKKDHTDIPDKKRSVVSVKLKNYIDYKRADMDFLAWLEKKDEKKALRAARMEVFSKITYMLRLAARLKAKRVARWIDWHQQSGEKLVVFSFVKPLLKALEDRYGHSAVRIDGEVRGAERMALIDRFQNDPSCKIALCNGKAAGVAVTLHAATWCLIADLPWSPALLWQMEDRIHRFGQKLQTRFVYLVAVGTVEERVMEVLRTKQRIIEKVMNKKSRRLDSEDLSRLSKSMSSMLINKVMKGSK